MSKKAIEPIGHSKPIDISIGDLVEYVWYRVVRVGFVVKIFDKKIQVENTENELTRMVKKTNIISSHKHLPMHINTFR